MAKLLIVGVDGATLDLVLPWSSQGLLPTFAGLLSKGAWGPLRSVPNTNSAPAWSSFATGLNPGRHGIFFFTERVPGTYRRRPLNGGDRQGRTFWSLAGEAGLRVGVINVPMTYPAEPVNGFVVAGLDTPGILSPRFTYPDALAQEVRSEIGEYIIEPGVPGLMKAGRSQAALDRSFLAMERRLACARVLNFRFKPDLIVVVFTAIDGLQHFFWGSMDRSYPYRDADADRFEDAIRQGYVRMDGVLKELMELAEPESVMVVSDHGAGFNQRGAEYLRPWLAMLGLLRHKDSGSLPRVLVRKAHGVVDRWLPREAKLRLAGLLPGVRSRVEATMELGDIDWPSTRVYCTGATDELYINLKGREPAGVVEPGAEYDDLCSYLRQRLNETKDAATGRPAVEHVLHRDEIYSGPFADRAPDLFIRWSTESVIQGLHTPGHGSAPGRPLPPPLQSGGHRPDGVFIAEGGAFRQAGGLRGLSLMDVAPTALHLLGLPVPAGLDGRVMEPVLDPAWAGAHPVRCCEPAPAGPGSPSAPYSDDEAEEIERRLRGMGYIE